MPCELVTWAQVERLAGILAKKIRQARYEPDIVIAIARGGYVPARLLCDHLDIFNLTSIRIIHYEAGARMIPGARLSMGLGTDVRNLKVLLVDDVSDTGDTLQLALEHIHGFHPAEIRIAVLHHKKVSRVVPDFHGQKLVKWRWITYPWAVREDLAQFLGTAKSPVTRIDAAAKYLLEQYGLRVPRRLIDELLT